MPDGKYAQFIERRDNSPLSPGNFVDLKGNVLCPHSGFERYTIGQRKGLGIALGSPKFVTKIDAETNRVTLGEREDLLTQQAHIKEVRLRDVDWLKESPTIEARIRYKSPAVSGYLEIGDEESSVWFDSPVWGVTPGQSLVMYKEGLVVGGGIIHY